MLPVSCDAVPSLKAYKKHEGMTVDLLSGVHRRAYDVLIEEKNHSKRAYLLVDKQGTLRWSDAEAETVHLREDAELLAEIAKL